MDGVYEETKDGETIKTGQSSGGLTINDSDFKAVHASTSDKEIGKQLGSKESSSSQDAGGLSIFAGMKDYRDFRAPLTQEELNKGKQDLELFEDRFTTTPTKEADVLSGAATKSDTANVIDLDEPQLETKPVDIGEVDRQFWGTKGLNDDNISVLSILQTKTPEELKGWQTDKSGTKLRAIYLQAMMKKIGINNLKKMPKLMKILSTPVYNPTSWEPPSGKGEGSIGSAWLELMAESEANISDKALREAIDDFNAQFSREFLTPDSK